MTASLVFNVNLDEAMINEDANFEKTVGMLETYLREGGVQFQLNYVSRETLIAANERPEDYSSLRVRSADSRRTIRSSFRRYARIYFTGLKSEG